MKRTSNIKYLGYGFLIGMIAASAAAMGLFLLLSNRTARAMILPTESTRASVVDSVLVLSTSTNAGISPSLSMPTFTPTPTFTYRISPTPSATPLPTATLTLGEQKVQSGDLFFRGPLTPQQQIQLYNTSITFIAPTTEESTAIGEQFAGVGYGSPTLICGPLSIAILQTSELLDFNVSPIDFWLLNPFLPKDREILNRAFPPEKYEHHETTSSLRNFDFSTFPLTPGDFLYIKHGSGGTYDHMLVVNRVDQFGRAYSVTNYNSGHGFLIDEVLLYDPLDPNAGMFKKWTRQRNAAEGATGFGGFELWRLRAQ